MSQAIKVHIFGQSYSIHGDLDEAYVQKLAVHVDEKMHAIAQMTPTMDTQKVAMLIGDRQVGRGNVRFFALDSALIGLSASPADRAKGEFATMFHHASEGRDFCAL